LTRVARAAGGLGSRGRRLAAGALGLAVAASVVRFVAEIRGVEEACCADFPIFEEAAEQWSRNERLYGRPLGEYGPGSGVYKFPPLLALLLAGGQAVAGGRVQGQVFLLQVAAYAVAVALLLLTLRRAAGAGPGTLMAVLVTALSFGPFFETLFRLQLENAMLLCIVVAGLALHTGAPVAAGAALGLATVIKLYPIHLLVPLWLTGRRRAALALVGTVVGVGGLSLVVVGLDDGLRYATEIVPALARENPTDQFGAENLGIHRLLGQRLNLDYGHSRVAGTLAFACAWLVSAGAVVRYRWDRADPRGIAPVLLFLPLMLMSLPNSWMNYQLLLLPAVAWLIAEGAKGGRLELVCGVCAGLILSASSYESEWVGSARFRLSALHPLAFQVWCDIRPLATLLAWLGLLRACTRPPLPPFAKP